MFRCRSAWGPGKFLLSLALACLVTTARAESPVQTFDIPAQPVAAALRALATQAGIQIVFTPEVVGAAQARALRGRMSVDEAIDRLLAGTGLKAQQDGAGNYVLSKATTGEANSMLSEMVVTATRTERRIEDVPASVSVINSHDLERQQLLKPEDALRNIEGIDFNTSASGGASVPMIRGVGGSFAGATSAVLVDSMPTDSSISSVVGRGGLNFLAEQDIDRIEVLRGPASALYGPNVVGGVVNVIPKRWTGGPGGEVSAEVGSHNARMVGAAVGTANDRLDIRLSAWDFKTDGYIAQPDPDSAGDKDLAPRGWQDRKWNLIAGVRPSDDQEITFAFQQFRTDTDYFGGRPNLRQNHHGDAYTLGYRKDLAGSNSFKVSYRHANLLQYMPYDDQEWNGNTGSYVLAATWFRRSITDTTEAQFELHPYENNTLIAGLSYQSAEFSTGWDDVLYGGTSRDKSKANTSALYIQDEHRVGDFSLTMGGRYDYIRQGASTDDGVAINNGASESTFNPRAGLRYALQPATSLYVSVGTAFVPASADLKYPGNPVRFVDNPDLKPETSITYEFGINHQAGWGTLRGAIYHTDYKDKISAISTGASYFPREYVNIGKVQIDGLELGMEGQLSGGWRPYANYTYTDSKIKENPNDPLTVGKQVQRIAPHKLNLGVTYAPTDAWSANFAGRYVSGRYFTDYNTADRRASAYFVADARLTIKLPSSPIMGQWGASFSVNNVFDRKYTVWEHEYADRRNIWLGVDTRF